MPVRQKVTPKINIPAVRGWCLKYVDDGINAPKRTATAEIAYSVEKKAKRIKTDALPVGVWVPIFFALSRGAYAGLGHVAWAKNNGKTVEIHDSETAAGARPPYSSIAQVTAWFGAFGCVYRGYSYQVDGRVVAEYYALPKPVAKKTARIGVKAKTAKVLVDVLNVRSKPDTDAKIMAVYKKDQTFVYDSYQIADGYVWLSYISRSGVRRYVAEGPYDGKKNSQLFVSGGVG